MLVKKIKENEYKIQFGYGVLGKTNLIDKVVSATVAQENELIPIRNMISVMAELLLAGLQKHHFREFGYMTDSEKSKKMDAVYDLLDQYEAESTEDNPQDGFMLWQELQDELEKNGFLSKATAAILKVAEEQNATMIPQDHKRKSK